MMRDYAKNTAVKQPAAKKKSKNDTANKNTNAGKTPTFSRSSNTKTIQQEPTFKKKTQFSSEHKKSFFSTKKKKKQTNRYSQKTNTFQLSTKAKYQLTSISVFLTLGLITLFLVLLLFYVMSNKKTTDIKEIVLPKPASFLNPQSLNPTKPAPVITIPVNEDKKNVNPNMTQPTPIPSENNQTFSDNTKVEPKFTFYDTLTKQTVQVDATPKAQQRYEYTYALQVGSYKNQNDANSMRARLLLLGFKPIVSKKGNYYTVSIGNINSKREGDIIKHKLEANNIQGSMLVQTDKRAIN